MSSVEVIDLCDDDDEDFSVGYSSKKRARKSGAAARAARAPPSPSVHELLGDNSSHPKLGGKENGKYENTWEDRKPSAARKRKNDSPRESRESVSRRRWARRQQQQSVEDGNPFATTARQETVEHGDHGDPFAARARRETVEDGDPFFARARRQQFAAKSPARRKAPPPTTTLDDDDDLFYGTMPFASSPARGPAALPGNGPSVAAATPKIGDGLYSFSGALGGMKSPQRKVAAAMKPPPTAASTVIDVTAPGPVVPPPLTPLEQVLEVFPDVDRNHAQTLLDSQGNNIMTVSAILAESSYPKSKTTQSFVHDDGVTLHRDKRQRKYDFMSTSSFEPSLEYTEQARSKLLQEFPFLSKNGVNKLLKAHERHYAIVHDVICRGIMGGPVDSKDPDRQEEQYRLLRSAMTGVHLSDEQHTRLMVGKRRTTVLHPRRNAQNVIHLTEPILQEELEYVKQKEAEWMEEVNMRMLRKQNRAAAERAGATMECPCCCFDVALDEMIACREEGHLFCVDCLRRFAENQIFTLGSFGVNRKTGKPATDLLCMHGDGCSSGFDVAHLRKALPEKIMDKYDELQYRAAVDAAGIELFSCPKCGIRAEIPQTQMIFHCPEASCGQETCKLCMEPAHIPLKCSEVEKKNETKGRLKVEEAISNAKIRTCPKPGCNKKFIKEDGCNKMTCGCGTWSCYVCRALITKEVSYKHFCQTPHCTHGQCNQCPLYSNAEEDDKRAMREAGIEAAEQVRGESLLSVSDTPTGVAAALPSEVRVDVDSLLKEPPKPTARRR